MFIKENPAYLCNPQKVREVAQPGSALVWGARGRKFESCLPDQFQKPINNSFIGFFILALPDRFMLYMCWC